MLQLMRGDIVFVRGTDWVSVAIEDITHSAYSHVALAVADHLLIEAVPGSPVRFAHALEYSGMADVSRTSLAPDDIETVMMRAQSHLGEPYDYFLDALEFVRMETGIQLPYREGHDIMCSMLVADSFRPEWDPCPGIEYPTPADEAQSVLWQHVFSY